jgi:hypothetical protein
MAYQRARAIVQIIKGRLTMLAGLRADHAD